MSLLEIGLVLGLLGFVMAGVSIPAMRSWVSSAKTKTAEDSLVTMGAATNHFVLRDEDVFKDSSKMCFSFDRDNSTNPRELCARPVNPWHVMKEVLADTFTGKNTYQQAYDAYITPITNVGVGREILYEVVSCLDEGDFKDYKPTRTNIAMDCTGTRRNCGSGFCSMTFSARVTPDQAVAEVQGEAEIMYPGNPGSPPEAYVPGTTADTMASASSSSSSSSSSSGK